MNSFRCDRLTKSFGGIHAVDDLSLTFPESGYKIPANTLKRVVLPEPFGPITPNVSPFSTLKETSFKDQNSSL